MNTSPERHNRVPVSGYSLDECRQPSDGASWSRRCSVDSRDPSPSSAEAETSRCIFVGSALQRFGTSHLALLIVAGGGSFGFQRQLLSLSNGFRFLRIRAGSDLPPSICAWHIFIVSHFSHARHSVLHRPATLIGPGLIVPPNLGGSGWDGTSTNPSGSWLFPFFQNVDLLSDRRHPVVDFFSLCFELGRCCSQLPSVVFQLSGIMFECINNRF